MLSSLILVHFSISKTIINHYIIRVHEAYNHYIELNMSPTIKLNIMDWYLYSTYSILADHSKHFGLTYIFNDSFIYCIVLFTYSSSPTQPV